MPHPYLIGTPHPRVLAHRGLVPARDAGHIAENSFAAFAAAEAEGVRYVESDCHLSRDGAVILFHDDTLERIVGDPRPIAHVTEAELSRLMADRGGLVTLSQALWAFPKLRFNLDVKAPRAAAAVGRAIVRDADRVLLTSFAEDRRRAALAAAGSARPATSPGREVIARLLAAVTLRSRRWASRLLDGIDAIQIPERQGAIRVLSSRLIDYAHAAGTEVHVWTVNDTDRMRGLAAMGVDGIVTDRADAALRALEA